MNEENAGPTQPEAEQPEAPKQETPPEQAQEPKKAGGISKWILIAGGGLLLLLAVAIVAGFLIFRALFSGNDPIAAVVPNDSLIYMSVDLIETQSEDFNHFINILQGISEEKQQTSVEALDEMLQDELGLSFTADILPWVGRHASATITEGDLSSGDVKFMFIVEATNQGNADEFITKFVAALEDRQGESFSQSEKDGVTLYVSGSGPDTMAIARSGKFLYLANSEDTILKSISLKKSDSLSNSESYKATLEALPKDRLSAVYINGKMYQDLFDSMSGSMSIYQTSQMGMIEHIDALGFSATVTNTGLQMDFVGRFNPEELTAFEKEALSLTYLPLTADELVPANTFFFLGANTAKSVASLDQTGNPLYSDDVQESFDLFEQQYGISLKELLGVLGGEFAVAIAPASDGLLNQGSNTNLGFTVIASALDEQGFVNWAEHVLDVASEQMGTPLERKSASFGKYELKEASIQETMALVYGADQGYIFLGSSSDMLRDGLNNEKSLASDETYLNTWKAFDSGSIPYMYLDMQGLMDLIAENADDYGMSDATDIRDKLKEIPVIAMAWNESPEYTRNATMIIFIQDQK